jgi:imidazolonepropionase-like amidohydrolase
MKCYTKPLTGVILIGLLGLAGCGPDASNESGKGDGKQVGASSSDTSFFYGGRLIPGDGSPAIEESTFIVSNGKFTAIGKKGEVQPPKGSARIELTGRTVTPVFINLQAQPGLNNGANYGPKNYNRDSMTADLARYEYYGVKAVLTAGTDSGDLASSVRDEVKQEKVKGARLYTAGRGIAAKGGGPAGLSETTIQVSGASDARKAVADLADKKVDVIKLWMDDGNGKGPKLKSDAYTAAIDEGHKHSLKVVAEVFDLSDAKDLVKAGIDGFVNSIRDREVDDALISAMKEKNVFLSPALTANEAKFAYADTPKWLGEQTMREVYPAQLTGYLMDQVIVNRFKRNAELPAYRQAYATAVKNLKALSAGGVKIALGTNSGAADTYPGYFELREMIAMADEAGMQPMDVIKAATFVPASVLGLNDLGTLAVGKTADFVAMPNNPLEKMSNIKDIGLLYVNGNEQERTALIQNIQVNTDSIKITSKERAADAEAEREHAKEEADAKLPHYGTKFPLGKSPSLHGVAIPVPKDSKVDVKAPDHVNVSIRASAADLKDFYAKLLAVYKWTPAGNCWEKESPGRRLCVEAANNSANITVTEK